MNMVDTKEKCPRCGHGGMVRGENQVWECIMCSLDMDLDESHAFEVARMAKIIRRDTIAPLRDQITRANDKIKVLQSCLAETEKVSKETDKTILHLQTENKKYFMIPIPPELDLHNANTAACDVINGPCACGSYHTVEDVLGACARGFAQHKKENHRLRGQLAETTRAGTPYARARREVSDVFETIRDVLAPGDKTMTTDEAEEQDLRCQLDEVKNLKEERLEWYSRSQILLNWLHAGRSPQQTLWHLMAQPGAKKAMERLGALCDQWASDNRTQEIGDPTGFRTPMEQLMEELAQVRTVLDNANSYTTADDLVGDTLAEKVSGQIAARDEYRKLWEAAGELVATRNCELAEAKEQTHSQVVQIETLQEAYNFERKNYNRVARAVMDGDAIDNVDVVVQRARGWALGEAEEMGKVIKVAKESCSSCGAGIGFVDVEIRTVVGGHYEDYHCTHCGHKWGIGIGKA